MGSHWPNQYANRLTDSHGSRQQTRDETSLRRVKQREVNILKLVHTPDGTARANHPDGSTGIHTCIQIQTERHRLAKSWPTYLTSNGMRPGTSAAVESANNGKWLRSKQLMSRIERRPTTTETRATYDNSTWHTHLHCGVYVTCIYRTLGGVIIGDSGLCCCGPAFNIPIILKNNMYID